MLSQPSRFTPEEIQQLVDAFRPRIEQMVRDARRVKPVTPTPEIAEHAAKICMQARSRGEDMTYRESLQTAIDLRRKDPIKYMKRGRIRSQLSPGELYRRAKELCDTERASGKPVLLSECVRIVKESEAIS